MTNQVVLDIAGFCPICRRETRFVAKEAWLRGHLLCQTCDKGSVPRERALALTLWQLVPTWKTKAIHESSPMERGLSIVLKRDCPQYAGSHYFPKDGPFGSMVKGWRNEDLESLTFADETFDITITQDVMEHVFNPQKVFQEVYRTLRPGGWFISTFPIRKYQVEAMKVRAKLDDFGAVIHLVDQPEYHGNPIDNAGSLVTVDYGYDIHKLITEWTGFDARVMRFSDRRHGILGEYTDVIACRKPGALRQRKRSGRRLRFPWFTIDVKRR